MLSKYNNFVIYFLIIVSIFAVFSCVSFAKYPEHQVEVTISYAAGGGTDLMARAIFPYFEEKLGVPFVIRNMPGAGAIIGYTHTATSKPDGYTIGNINSTSITTVELIQENVTWRFKEDIQPVAQIVYDAFNLLVRSDCPFETLTDFINYAKEHPGEINWGGSGYYSGHHVHMLYLERETGIELNYVVFSGAAEERAALLGGHVDCVSGGLSEYISLVEDGELRILASARSGHWKDYPDIPTYIDDYGIDIDYGSGRAFGVAAGTPDEIVQLLANTFKEVMEDPRFLADAEKLGFKFALDYKGPEQLTEEWGNYQDEILGFLPEEELSEYGKERKRQLAN